MPSPRELAVVMPMFNAARHVAPAIESILRQTHAAFEFLIVDDGSTDGSVDCVRAIVDHRIRLVTQTGHRGIAQCLNDALTLTDARYVARMDADDIAHPTRFTRQLAYMRAHPKVAVCGSGMRLFGDGFTARTLVFPREHSSICARQLFNCQLGHSTVMLDTGLLRMHGLAYSTQAAHAEDYDLWARVAQVAQLHNLPDVLLDNRQHPDQVGKRHAALQRATADNVRRYLLRALGVDCNDREWRLHCTYCVDRHLPLDVSDAEGIRWFRKLARAAGWQSAFGIAMQRVCLRAIARVALRGPTLRAAATAAARG